MTRLLRPFLLTPVLLATGFVLTFAFSAPTSLQAQRGRPVVRRPIVRPIPVPRAAPPIFFRFPQRIPPFTPGPEWNFQYRWFPGCGIFPGYSCGRLWVYYPPPPLYSDEAYLQHPQLALKNGTVYSVTDYWLLDNKLHFITLEDGGAESLERVIDFDQLDVQKSIDLDAQRGFRFVLRNEPIDQYIKDHPELGTGGRPLTRPPAQP